jgi:hypothetical protein
MSIPRLLVRRTSRTSSGLRAADLNPRHRVTTMRFMAMVKSSENEALELTTRFMELHREHWRDREGETEIRQIFDASDLAPR